MEVVGGRYLERGRVKEVLSDGFELFRKILFGRF